MREIAHQIAARLLDQPVPLSEAQDLEPDWVPDIPFSDPRVPAAVLIGLFERADELHVVYTVRSSALRNHSGQVAFPGGKIDAASESARDAALREAREEIGLRAQQIDILGYLPPYYTGTNFLITPVVAHIQGDDPFALNQDEVSEVFEVPLSFLANAENYQRRKVEIRDRNGHTWSLDYKKHVIWGITANLTHAFYATALQ